ncbi:hypothetical protein M8332_00195 [Fructilactobacillus ixorae]|uniref:ASCH domain-containing protein n=1 Tax=Fructilactobacillus ixorae TaxID=1750535 RepID=A0ABY5C7J7_9LACO|nr:hypothetical protein [Fructilactobacillus ixorae]USS93325.1 hypothetical protein M8332_00195 [Fructilactobacillus ixorae]
MINKISEVYNPLLPTLLISIHREYVEEIKKGYKVVEYRKSFFKEPFQAFIYTSGKNGGIEAFILCDQPIISDAKKLANIGSIIENDSYNDIFDYFKEKNTGVIIPIIAVYQIHPIKLNTLRKKFDNFNAPQKYTFLDNTNKKNILEYLLSKTITKSTKNNWSNYYRKIKNEL